MELSYENFYGLNIDEEIRKINEADVVKINVTTTDKAQLFLMGMLFAANKKIKVMNKEELNFDNKVYEDLKSKTGKSFLVMTYVWEKLFDEEFPKKDFSNVLSDFDRLIENTKRLGISSIANEPIDNKFFVICPVRNATEAKKIEMKEYVDNAKESGYIVHNPNGDTVQEDKFGGYAICRQNAFGMSSSSEIRMFYDQSSKGSMFDLGVAYYLNKPLKVLNEDKIKYDETDFGDYIVKNWDNRVLPKRLVK